MQLFKKISYQSVILILLVLNTYQYLNRKQLEKKNFELKLALDRGTPTQIPEVPNALIFTKPLKPVTVDVSDITVDDLAGDWLLTMTMGAIHNVRLVKESNTILTMDGRGSFKGQYIINDGFLMSSELESVDLYDHRWQIESPDRMRLVYSVIRTRLHNNYTGAILTRREGSQ